MGKEEIAMQKMTEEIIKAADELELKYTVEDNRVHMGMNSGDLTTHVIVSTIRGQGYYCINCRLNVPIVKNNDSIKKALLICNFCNQAAVVGNIFYNDNIHDIMFTYTVPYINSIVSKGDIVKAIVYSLQHVEKCNDLILRFINDKISIENALKELGIE